MVRREGIVTGRILLVEDDAMNHAACVLALGTFGYQVVATWNGEEASRARGPFDAVLSDIQMPIMDGIDLCHHLHERDRQLPIILMSGSAPPSILSTPGVFRFLRKPASLDMLLSALSDAIRHRRAQLAMSSTRVPAE